MNKYLNANKSKLAGMHKFEILSIHTYGTANNISFRVCKKLASFKLENNVILLGKFGMIFDKELHKIIKEDATDFFDFRSYE